MRAYREEVRKKMIAAREKGESAAMVARRYRVAVRTVERYWKRFCETSEIAPKRHGGYRQSKLAPHDALVLGWIKQQPDLTLMELQEQCLHKLKVRISLHALWYRLERLGLSFKKNDARRRAR